MKRISLKCDNPQDAWTITVDTDDDNNVIKSDILFGTGKVLSVHELVNSITRAKQLTEEELNDPMNMGGRRIW